MLAAAVWSARSGSPSCAHTHLRVWGVCAHGEERCETRASGRAVCAVDHRAAIEHVRGLFVFLGGGGRGDGCAWGCKREAPRSARVFRRLWPSFFHLHPLRRPASSTFLFQRTMLLLRRHRARRPSWCCVARAPTHSSVLGRRCVRSSSLYGVPRRCKCVYPCDLFRPALCKPPSRPTLRRPSPRRPAVEARRLARFACLAAVAATASALTRPRLPATRLRLRTRCPPFAVLSANASACSRGGAPSLAPPPAVPSPRVFAQRPLCSLLVPHDVDAQEKSKKRRRRRQRQDGEDWRRRR